MSSKTAYTSANALETTMMQANRKRKRTGRKGHKKGRSTKVNMICKESHTNIEEISRISANLQLISSSSSELLGAYSKLLEG